MRRANIFLRRPGPFEHLFAEGYMYRQAVEKPRSLIVVLGIWFIFGSLAAAAMVLTIIGLRLDARYALVSVFILSVSVVMIWKTTRNYLARPRAKETPDA